LVYIRIYLEGINSTLQNYLVREVLSSFSKKTLKLATEISPRCNCLYIHLPMILASMNKSTI